MRKVRGSATVEMAYIMPVVFLTVIAVIYILFYMHDKNIICGAEYETLTAGCQKARWAEENLEEQMEEIFQERIKGKLIFFSIVYVEVKHEKDMFTIKANAKRKKMKIRMEQKRKVIIPENDIRNLRWINGNQI